MISEVLQCREITSFENSVKLGFGVPGPRVVTLAGLALAAIALGTVPGLVLWWSDTVPKR